MPPPPRQPWPMKWVILVILVCLVAYTYLTLHYRRADRVFRPYQDLKDRANVHRLIDAGFQRITLNADLPVEAAGLDAAAPTTAALGGLPPVLRDTLVEPPQLPGEIVAVAAAPSANSMFDYPIAAKCTLPDNKLQLAGAQLYVHGTELVVTPEFERLSGGLLARSRERLIRLTVPAGSLKPGHYRVTLVGTHSSRVWTLQVH